MTGPAILYTTMQNDRWDSLAWRFYGDATAISPILLANCGLRVPFEAVLDAGIQLAIPVIYSPTSILKTFRRGGR